MSIRSVLEEAKEKNTLVSIHVNSDDWNQYSVGYVDVITNTHVRLRAVSRYGEPAGYEIRVLAEICKIESDGKYEQKLEKLSKNQGKIFKEIAPAYGSGNLILDALTQSLKEKILIALWGNDPDDTLTGYVEKLEDDTVSIRLIDEYGKDDGVSTIAIDEITSLDFNTQPEQVRNFIYRDKI